MDKYLADPADNKGALAFGYFDTTNMPEGKLAQQYTIADNFHQSSFGGSFLDNTYAACACTPQIPLSAIPPGKVEPVDANGDPTVIGGKESRATPDGFLVNTAYTTQYPQIVNFTTSNVFVPPLLNQQRPRGHGGSQFSTASPIISLLRELRAGSSGRGAHRR